MFEFTLHPYLNMRFRVEMYMLYHLTLQQIDVRSKMRYLDVGGSGIVVTTGWTPTSNVLAIDDKLIVENGKLRAVVGCIGTGGSHVVSWQRV